MLAVIGLSVRYHEGIFRRVRAYRVNGFLTQAEKSYRAGEAKAGNLAVGAALALEPNNFQAQLLRANWLLRLGPKEDGIAAWRALIETHEASNPRGLPLQYASQLVNTGTLDELFVLSVRQLSRQSAWDQGIWMNLAAESCRNNRAEVGTASLAKIVSREAAAGIRAYALASRQDKDAARAVLIAMDAQSMSRPVAVLAARAWLALGDETSARTALNRSRRAIDSVELAASELMFEPGSPAVESRLVDRLFFGAAPEGDLRRRAGLLATYGLRRANRMTAEQTFNTLRPVAAKLDAETLASLWVYSGRSGHEGAELFWRERLDPLVGKTLPKLTDTRLSPSLLAVITERTPLPIEVVCALMSVTE